MRDTAEVIGTEKNGSVKVMPLIKDACISCTATGCAKRGSVFYVSNPDNIMLCAGMHVKVVASKKSQILQAFVTLCVPCGIAVMLYIMLSMFQDTVRDAGIILISLVALFVSAAIIFFVSKKLPPTQGSIIATLEDDKKSQ
ncbi:MAG: SoxR reducing system RseC family protein [Spirochaetales bacterium]